MDRTPISNRVRGPFCELRAGFFAKRAGHKSEGKKRRSEN